MRVLPQYRKPIWNYIILIKTHIGHLKIISIKLYPKHVFGDSFCSSPMPMLPLQLSYSQLYKEEYYQNVCSCLCHPNNVAVQRGQTRTDVDYHSEIFSYIIHNEFMVTVTYRHEQFLSATIPKLFKVLPQYCKTSFVVDRGYF